MEGEGVRGGKKEGGREGGKEGEREGGEERENMNWWYSVSFFLCLNFSFFP